MNNVLLELFTLLLVFQVKHFVADFPMQNTYMLGKFKPHPDYILPLLAHSSVHGILTLLIGLTYGLPILLIGALAVADTATHFAVDRIKASPNMLGKYKTLSATEFKELMAVLKDTNSSNSQIDEAAAKMKSNTYFWWSIGLDQMLHHVTHYLIVFTMVAAKMV